ncbi:MAG: VOC family protein [Rhodospirillaceae bacterium]|nr:VOC family protein [Rhodospirillaceae bacterium]
MKTFGAVVATLAVGLSAGFIAGGEAAAPEKVTGIGGIFFKSKDPKATADWYAKNLGVVIEKDGPMSFFMWKEVDRPGPTARTVWSIFPQDTDYFGPGASEFMINYRVRDLDTLLKHLRTGGAQVVGKTEDYPYGRFAWVVDNEGRKIELWQPIGE